MKDNELLFDRKSHVLYSKPCKKEIRAKIALHYPEAERETVWEKVQRQYAVFLSDWRTDLGGKKNFHNGVGGTYDCIAIMSYYVVCKAVTSFREIEEMEENLILPTFRKLKFVDCNKPFWRKLMYKAFVRAKSGCDKWHDYEMTIAPYENGKRTCPVPWHRHSELPRGGDHLYAAPGGGREQGQSVSRRRALRCGGAHRRGADDSCGAAVFSELRGGRHAL